MSASSSSSASAAAGASSDPYAPFYYWDASSNNWAFDYDSYYATYGYPSTGTSASAYPSPYPDVYQTAGADPGPDFDPNTLFTHASASASASAPNGQEKKNEAKQGDDAKKYDEHGRIIPGKLAKGETRQTVIRRAGGKVWEDQTLLEWDPTHKRLFIGDLGNDVSDATLAAAFEKYPSFSKARVVRNKDGKPKGFGFVAFADPHDFLRAWKEMDRKYIGSRPCRIKKADDVVKPVQIGARKDKQLAIQAKFDSQQYRTKMGGAIGKHLRRNAGSSKPYGRS